MSLNTAKDFTEPESLSLSDTDEHHDDRHDDMLLRLRKIEGQVKALGEMIQRGRPCEDVAMQMSAARKALDKVFYRWMASAVIDAACAPRADSQTRTEVERSVRLLERFG